MADRHQFRANWHDYNGGIYFVTVCCADKQHLLGKIISGPKESRFVASAIGNIVEQHIQKIPSFYNDVEICNFVVMPNHIHIVLSIDGDFNADDATGNIRTTSLGCLKPPRHGDPAADFHHNSRLASIIGAFKAGVTRHARTRLIASTATMQSGSPASRHKKIWQSRYHEHIIRNQQAYDNIMNYIDTNVENWCYDKFNPNRIDTPAASPSGGHGTDAPSGWVGTRLIASTATKTNEFDAGIDNADAMNRVPTAATTTPAAKTNEFDINIDDADAPGVRPYN